MILNNQNDAKKLAQYNSRMTEYSDDGKRFNAFYGTRMRETWGDQLLRVIDEIMGDYGTRQAVIQIWSADDLGAQTKDKACNLAVVFRRAIRGKNAELDMTVYNRSNDIVWGMFGTNLVQFTMLHEVVAAMTRLKLGVYTHVTSCVHFYEHHKQLVTDFTNVSGTDEHEGCEKIPLDDSFFHDIAIWDTAETVDDYFGDFFKLIVFPMRKAWEFRKDSVQSREYLRMIEQLDWRWACLHYLTGTKAWQI